MFTRGLRPSMNNHHTNVDSASTITISSDNENGIDVTRLPASVDILFQGPLQHDRAITTEENSRPLLSNQTTENTIIISNINQILKENGQLHADVLDLRVELSYLKSRNHTKRMFIIFLLLIITFLFLYWLFG